MRTRFYAFFYFFLTIAAVVLTLTILNRLPLVLQSDTLRPYKSLDEVRSKLSINDLHVPSYFPETITWPPARILAQSRPYPAVLMVFSRPREQEPALVISQAASGSFPENEFIRFTEITEKVPYQLKGRNGVLEVGACGDQPCSRLAWTEGDFRITVLMKSPPFELIKIAGSMLH